MSRRSPRFETELGVINARKTSHGARIAFEASRTSRKARRMTHPVLTRRNQQATAIHRGYWAGRCSNVAEILCRAKAIARPVTRSLTAGAGVRHLPLPQCWFRSATKRPRGTIWVTDRFRGVAYKEAASTKMDPVERIPTSRKPRRGRYCRRHVIERADIFLGGGGRRMKPELLAEYGGKTADPERARPIPIRRSAGDRARRPARNAMICAARSDSRTRSTTYCVS